MKLRRGLIGLLRLLGLRDKGLVCRCVLLVATLRRQHGRRRLLGERLGPAPRLVGFAGLIAFLAWGFSDPDQKLTAEKELSPLVVKAQFAPREPGSVWQVSSPQPTPEALTPFPTIQPQPSTAIVLKPPFDVVDVRTIRAGERTITLAGIDGIGRNTTCRARDGTRWSCEKLATDALRKLTISQSLSCEPTVEMGAVGVVATCKTSTGHDLARTLVAEGWAHARNDAPPQYRSEQKRAEERGLGLWGWRLEEKRARR
jgi:endonuclease YncB( thermonuclease family)